LTKFSNYATITTKLLMINSRSDNINRC